MMPAHEIEPEQHIAARLAGALYLAAMANALVGELFLRVPLLVSGDAVRTARNILASETRFRMSIVIVLITAVCDVVLLLAVYVALERTGRYLALLAALFRLVGCCVLALTVLSDFVALSLLGGAGYLQVFKTEQLQALARMFLSVRHSGGLIGGVFLGLGSAVFAYLWLRSRYIPRALAAFGIFASLVLSISILGLMALPNITSILGPAYWAPTFIFEVTLGVWLLAKGLHEESKS